MTAYIQEMLPICQKILLLEKLMLNVLNAANLLPGELGYLYIATRCLTNKKVRVAAEETKNIDVLVSNGQKAKEIPC